MILENQLNMKEKLDPRLWLVVLLTLAYSLQHSISKHGRLRKGQTTHLAELPRCLGEGVQKWKLWLGPASSCFHL